jgi:hypothetical protein
MQTVTSIAALVAVLVMQAPPPVAVLSRHIEALGGEAALRGIRSRITDGQFDNGRGLKTRFRTYEAAPNKRTTIIGTAAIEDAAGSGRGYDGAAGWDKNFIGTGLRTLAGPELAAVAREADLLRPLHLFDDCESPRVESGAQHDVVICQPASGTRTRTRFEFDRKTGLLAQQETEAENGRATRLTFEDYRGVDGIRLPFRTRIVLPGAAVLYTTESVRHNVPIEERVFQTPSS